MFNKIAYPKIFISSLLFVILVLQQIVGIMPPLNITWLGMYGIIIFVLYSISEYNSVYKPMLLFLCYISFSLLILSPPEIFNVWMRLVLFVIITMIVFPIISNYKLDIFRLYCLKIIVTAFIILSVISFFCFFLNVNYMVYEAEMDFSEKGGLFSGLMTHSIILGIISGISICTLTYLAVMRSWIFILLIIPCFGSLMFAASRGAIIATFIGCFIMLLYMLSNNRLRKRVALFFTLSIVGIILSFTYTDVTLGVEAKFIDRDEKGLLSSREDKINHRVEEFKSSPLIGIGFSTIDISGGDEFNKKTGVIEPGSSWYAILSMCGIIGLIFILYIFWQALRNIIRCNNSSKYLYISLLTFFVLSMYSEGYIFAGGSSLCLILWLTLGCCLTINKIDFKP
ncbi:MAG: O-antigen ligase family protein [Rikenellaceae bacterium]|nr:O-antigen ligase family protein [Rikenellaceae bacterium]